MSDDVRRFPDIDEYTWLIETVDLKNRWGRWSSTHGPYGGTVPRPLDDDPVAVAKQMLGAWFQTAVTENWDLEDLWVRASVWRLGRVVDGGLIHSTPYDLPNPAGFGRVLYASDIDPDAVEVRTPFQIGRIGDEIRHQLRTRPVDPPGETSDRALSLPARNADRAGSNDERPVSADPVHDVLGNQPVEFTTAGELANLMARLPADTPVMVAHAIRIDPSLPGSEDEERTVAAARALALPRMVRVAGQVEQRPVPTVELGAFYAARHRPVPATTIPVNPYSRAVEAILAGDDDTMFVAFRELLRFVAGSLDGQEDASLYEQIEGDPALTAQAELDAALLRHVAERLAALRIRIGGYLTHPDQPA